MASLPMESPRVAVTRNGNLRRGWLAASVLLGLFAFGWGGMRIQPARFEPLHAAPVTFETVPLRAGLPLPVARFYQQRYGERVPLVQSAVISGRGTMRLAPLFNLTFPTRFRFFHDAGRSYRHYIEVTFFGVPMLKVNEYYVDGKERQELPWAVATDNPKLDQAGNLGMWAEIIQWLPSVLVTDPTVRWEPIDEETAILVVPFGDEEERFVVRFSPTTGDILYWEVMRYADGMGEKRLWVNGTWFDDGEPWFVIDEEQIDLNVSVDTSFTAKGP